MNTEVEHHGTGPAGAELVGGDRLVWRSPTTDHADLRSSTVTSLIVDGIAGPLTLRLPPTVGEVSLGGDLDAVRIDGLVATASLVQLWGDVSSGIPTGIATVHRLEISDTSALDLEPLATMSELRELTVRNVPGPITNCSAIASASKLERIAFMRCYDIDTAGFPESADLPHLTWISFDDIDADDATILRARIDGFWNGHVRRPRSRKWLATNTENPFRTWGDEAPALGQHVTTVWRRTRARLRHSATPAAREAAIQHLADTLDAISDDHLLDTLRREQAGDVIRELAHENLPPSHPLATWEPA